MKNLRLEKIESKASKVFTLGEFVNEFLRPMFRAADVNVSNAGQVAEFKARVIEIVSRELRIDQSELLSRL